MLGDGVAGTLCGVRVLAVDWSGKDTRESEFIWLAEARDGQLVSLENGRSREQLIEHVITLAEDDQPTAVGLDFAFSFPRWWCEEQGWTNVRDVWAAMADHGDDLLELCEPPFWGRPGRRKQPKGDAYRRPELGDADRAKSVFQIGGAGAVGTGSVRGIKYLQTLAASGFDVWPFGPTGWPRVVEIYPRILTGPVNKSSWHERHARLFECFSGQPARMLERAAGSEDAFDAAVSALAMARHSNELAALTPADDPHLAIEGRIWRPEAQ
jgi:hypothetical protein